MTRQQFECMIVNRFFPGNILQSQKFRDHLQPQCGTVEKRLFFQFTQGVGKSKIFPAHMIKQRLDPEPVPGKKQFLYLSIKDGKGKTAIEFFQHISAVFPVQSKEHFGVVFRFKNTAVGTFQLITECHRIENSSVKDHLKSAADRCEYAAADERKSRLIFPADCSGKRFHFFSPCRGMCAEARRRFSAARKTSFASGVKQESSSRCNMISCAAALGCSISSA